MATAGFAVGTEGVETVGAADGRVDADGGFGADGTVEEDVDLVGPKSERYAEFLFAPVSTPAPVFLSLGMPPARMPPSCGAAACEAVSDAPGFEASLVARGLLLAPPPPGAGGAPAPGGAAALPGLESTIGAERSLVTAFFSLMPFSISPSRAP